MSEFVIKTDTLISVLSKMLNDCIKPYIARHGGGILTFITNPQKQNRNQ